MENKELEWQIVNIVDFYSANPQYGYKSNLEYKYGIFHDCKRKTFPYLGYTGVEGICYKCRKKVPNYILFQWKLLNGK